MGEWGGRVVEIRPVRSFHVGYTGRAKNDQHPVGIQSLAQRIVRFQYGWE